MTPIWFGCEARPLFGWFHAPSSGRAKAGVVICPPFGHEYMETYYTLRLLAERLTEEGLCVLRFDYDGTGDSAGDSSDNDRVPAWLNSVDAALDVLRRAGTSSVFAIGMRMGALLAGIAAEKHLDLEGLVLWDPVVSGRAYVTEQRALIALAFEGHGSAQDGRLEAPGLSFDAPTVSELRKLDLSRGTGPLARQVLVLQRTDRPSAALSSRLDMPHVEWTEATGQADLMEAGAAYGAVPYKAIDAISSWVSRTAPVAGTDIEIPAPARTAAVARTGLGAPLFETPTFLGRTGLFGILTEPLGTCSSTTALFLNVGNGSRIGPGRLWVDLARQWAAAGLRCFRLDLSGLGDSPLRHYGQLRNTSRVPEAFDDIVDACSELRPEDPSDVILVGLCSSGYLVLESALSINPRAVVSINPSMSFRPPERDAGKRLDPRRRIALPRSAPIGKYYQSHYAQPSPKGFLHRPVNLGRLLRAIAAPRHPWARALRELVRSAVTTVSWRRQMLLRPSRRSATWLAQLAAKKVDVSLVCGQAEARPIRMGASDRTLNRLAQTGSLHFSYRPDLEHLLFIPGQRAQVTGLITEHVITQFAATLSASPPPGAPCHQAALAHQLQ
jgi:alpha-beta hydrolase superfamily lysophospholipase